MDVTESRTVSTIMPSTTAGSVEEREMMASSSSSRFSAVDYAVFVLMLVASVVIGVVTAFKSRNKTSTQEYLLGGRKMSPIPVAFSLLGGWVSAISILGNATEMYLYGTQLTTSLLGTIPGVIFVGKVILPVFYNLKLVSINEYIELRYGSRHLRKFVTICCVTINFFYMGMCLYAPTLALAASTGLPTWSATLIMGSICTVYITIGGVKAVVYTDVLQTLLMFGGVLAVVIVSSIDLGGLNNVWSLAQKGGRIQFFNMDTSPFERHTFLSTVVMGFYLVVSNVGFNPTMYQRYASVSSLKTAQSLNVAFLIGLWTLWIIFFYSGVVAFATYLDCDPLSSGRIERPDMIIPYLVMDKLSHLKGLAGVFVAAVYGGVLSSLSSCANSISCIIWEDILKGLPYFSRLPDHKATNVVKITSAVTGVLAVLMGLMVESLGSIFQVTFSVSAAFGAPMYGVFFTGIITPWVTAKGACGGFMASLSLTLSLVIGKLIRGGGSPSKLPLSTAGCSLVNATTTLSNSLVSTLATTTMASYTLATTTPSTDVFLATTDTEHPESKTFFDISYCYVGILGIATTTVVGSLLSVYLGPTHPKSLSEGVVSPKCLQAYQWLWDHLQKRSYSFTDIKQKKSQEETEHMMPKQAVEMMKIPVTEIARPPV